MATFEYKVIPAPKRRLKGKGVKGNEARFAHALEELMNPLGAEGWEYLRTDTLPMEERLGLTGRNKTFQNMLVFRRRTDVVMEAPAAPVPVPVPVSAPVPEEPVEVDTPEPEPVPPSPAPEPKPPVVAPPVEKPIPEVTALPPLKKPKAEPEMSPTPALAAAAKPQPSKRAGDDGQTVFFSLSEQPKS